MPSRGKRQFCTPHLVDQATATTTKLERLPLAKHPASETQLKDENWFQDLIFKNPTLIPIDDLEQGFGPLIPVVRELQTGRGPVDVVYINEQGCITLVETKLSRNPEARREVVAQILDYAASMSGWTYQDLCSAVRAKLRSDTGAARTIEMQDKSDADPLQRLVRDHPDFDESLFDEARFVDAVSRNLARGRFLLLIVGDGIQPSVEQLVETLAKTPHLGFSLALLELALFKSGESEGSFFVQPRVLTRTREVVRAVVELRAPLTPADVKISPPEVINGAMGGARRGLTMETLLESIGATLGKPTLDQFRAFLCECEKLGIEPEGRATSITLCWYEPNIELPISLASVYADGGVVNMQFVLHHYRRSGLDQMIGLKYLKAIAALVPGARVEEGEGKASKMRIFVGPRQITLADLMPQSAGWIEALRNVIQATEAAAATSAP